MAQPVTAVVVALDWPPTVLNPNSRVHWRPKAKAKRGYREASRLMTLEQAGWQSGIPLRPSALGYTLTVEFWAPDRRSRDRDNLLASIKAGLDGVAEALGIDDASFREVRVLAHRVDPQRRGRVVLTLIRR